MKPLKPIDEFKETVRREIAKNPDQSILDVLGQPLCEEIIGARTSQLVMWIGDDEALIDLVCKTLDLDLATDRGKLTITAAAALACQVLDERLPIPPEHREWKESVTS